MEEEGTQREAVVVVGIARMMKEGLPVFDVNGMKIGPVHRYDLDSGYMVVEHGALEKRRLYIPFHLILTITPKEIFLAAAQVTLTDDYLVPPLIKPVVEEWTNPLTGRTEEVIWHELRSGYDERLARIMPVSLDEVTTNITVGMTVVDVDDDYVGEIIDRDNERLIVRDDIASDAVHIVPFGLVARVSLDDLAVTLLIPKLALPRYASSQEIQEMSAQGTGADADDR
jgi:hypothetical protein